MDLNYETYDTDDDLQHHGVKGQKWGVRRYQNKDGSLTSLGRIHLNALQKALTDKGVDVDEVKRKIRIGAHLAGGALAVVGTVAASVAVRKYGPEVVSQLAYMAGTIRARVTE